MADELFAWMAALRVSVAKYHGQMSDADREAARRHFMNGTARVMVATKAFGMGIDKPDIRFVVHYQSPDSLESYFQEAGRAGRDGGEGTCTLLYRLEDRRVQSFFLARKYPGREQVAAFVRAVGEGVRRDAKSLAAAAHMAERQAAALAARMRQLGDGESSHRPSR